MCTMPLPVRAANADPMELINYFSDIPEENIAFDEFILEKAEAGDAGETLRFWESPEYFVVMGRSGKLREECVPVNSGREGVRVLRRCSGGGTVLQGPGCVNYSMILEYPPGESRTDITVSYDRVLGRVAEAFRAHGMNAEVLPLSDLALNGRKFSGNAQARKRRYFLHHGTLLLDLDLCRIAKHLKHPPKEPEYRVGREHLDFLVNLSISRTEAEDIILEAFPCEGSWRPSADDMRRIKDLARGKYSSEEWNGCF
ncbi:MAG: lipoate--protein ligase family protein [Candidatus Omnitrophica bacterium]|nr:lipoate--protein ligase family protein [Candidatus Omnitrophota bacterium]